MKFTLSWLKDHLETDATLDEISQTLTAIGLEVEGVENPADQLRAFTVAAIEEATQHPNADRLRVCKVNNGKEILQIVCGAPNARAGIKVALAPVGVVIPTNGLKIKPSKIRDVESNGMLCSAEELGLGEDSAGIIELPEDAQIGTPIVDALGLDDPLIEIAITPNRADCTGVYGIARDLAAAGLGTLKPLPEVTEPTGEPCAVDILLEDEGCKAFIGCSIQGVQNGASPDWLQRRLKAIGLRPISALVDITNYLSFDLGRPLHVYDVDKLQGNIVVKNGCGGQTLDALNDKSYTVDDDAIAITDDSGVIGLGGVVGGTSTGCDASTTHTLLEVAYFEPARIAATGRKHQIESDARYRFERGVDPAFLLEGARQALRMILAHCGGTPSQFRHVGDATPAPREIPFRPAAINARGGTDIAEEIQKKVLTDLGFNVEGNIATPPSWRGDIEGEADLAEEVLRIIGYDQIEAITLPKPAGIIGDILTPLQSRCRKVRKSLAHRGLTECYNWSFLSEAQAKLFGGNNPALKLANPISSELDMMRPSLLPHLLNVAARNANRGNDQNKLFEIGLQYHNIDSKGQNWSASVLLCGNDQPKNHYLPERKVDLFDAKAEAYAIIESTGFDPLTLAQEAGAPDWYHPGRSGTLKLGKQVIGYFGELHPRIIAQFKTPAPTVGCEIMLERLPFAKRKSKTRKPLAISDYQAVLRDFAFVVDRKLPANDLLKAIQGSEKKLIQKVELFDVYEGEHVDADKKSLALNVTLQAADRTLDDKEIDNASRSIISAAEKLGATLRA